MEHKIIDIFPKAVMKFNIGRELTNSETKFIKTNENKFIQNTGNTFSKDTFVLENDEMKEIKKFCDEGLQTYFNKIYNPVSKTEIYITQSWLNWTKDNGYHHTHDHPNSYLSGVFYVSADDNDSIAFGRTHFDQFNIWSKEINDYNTKEVHLKVKTGDLIIFPSTTIHFVPPIKTSKTRISLAFNSFLKGEVGLKSTLDYLKL